MGGIYEYGCARSRKKEEERINELRDMAMELGDLFFTEKETGKIREWYFNPNSSHEGSLVENVIYAGELLKVAEQYSNLDDFYGYLESECKQWYHDIDADGFEETLTELLAKKKKKTYSFIGADENTMNGLISFAKEYLRLKDI